MDAEKFDKIVLDLLYGELDELTRAAALRHLDQSARARALYAELRATREVGALPREAPPPDLEARILAAEAEVRAARPLRVRFGQLVSVVAGYAMRPQLAMAALLMLLIGSSLVLLRARPGVTSSVLVTEEGVEENERESATVLPVPPRDELRPPAPRAVARAEDRRGTSADPRPAGGRAAEPAAPRRNRSASAGSADTARSDDDLGAAQEAAPAAKAAPIEAAAEARTAESGCDFAPDELDSIAAGIVSGEAAPADVWAAAVCEEARGRAARARAAYRALVADPTYGPRARAALDRSERSTPSEAASPRAAGAAPP